MKRLFTLLVLLAGTASAHAQSGEGSLDELPVLHVTDRLMQRPATQQAHDAYQQRLAQDQAHLQAAVSYEVDDTLDFQVYNFVSNSYDTLAFSLQRSEERFLLWVETAQLDSLTDEAIDVIRDALGTATPPGSYDPGQGIIANDEDIFGLPPNVDGDGKSDVLLLDVRDGWEPGEGFIAGFVDGADLSAIHGNGRDILYLDARPGLYANGRRRDATNVAATAAHEYQHLIHLRYDHDEIIFVNEGLSEWAEIVNGYAARTPSCLTDVMRYNVPLFRWSTGVTSDVLDDYQRAGLFTNYVAERLGVIATGALTRDARNGDESYRQALAPDVTLASLVLDYHTANLLNDTGVDEHFGYETPQRAATGVAPSHTFDGTAAAETPTRPDTLSPGGALFLEWTDVQDFALTFDVDPADLARRPALRERTGLRVVLEQPDGTITTRDIAPRETPELFAGAFARVALVATHVAPGVPAGSGDTPVTYGATWSGTATAAEAPALTGTLALDPAFPNPFRDRAAIRYHLPQHEHVHLAVYDVLGRRVASLVDAPLPAGTHRAEFDGTALASGFYIVRLTTGSRTLTQTLLRVD